MHIHIPFGDVQSETDAALGLGVWNVDLMELLEGANWMLFRDAGACIRDGDGSLALTRTSPASVNLMAFPTFLAARACWIARPQRGVIMMHGRNSNRLKTLGPEMDDVRLVRRVMQYLVELKLSTGSRPNSWVEGREFIEDYVFPTLERCKTLAEEKRIVAGGPQSGAVALSLIVEVATVGELDELITSLPVWPRMETSVTPLTTFEDRRRSILALLETVKVRGAEKQGASASR